jgi:hypothetical protein
LVFTVTRELLDNYSEILEKYHEEIMNELKDLETQSEKECQENLKKAMEIAEEIRMNISVTKEMNLLEMTGKQPVGTKNELVELLLPGQEEHSEEPFKAIPYDIQKKVIPELLFTKIQKLINDYILPLKESGLTKGRDHIFSKSWSYFFFTLEFLSDSGLMTRENFKRIHHNFQIVKAFVNIHNDGSYKENKKYFNGLLKFTEQKYWEDESLYSGQIKIITISKFDLYC